MDAGLRVGIARRAGFQPRPERGQEGALEVPSGVWGSRGHVSGRNDDPLSSGGCHRWVMGRCRTQEGVNCGDDSCVVFGSVRVRDPKNTPVASMGMRSNRELDPLAFAPASHRLSPPRIGDSLLFYRHGDARW